MLYGCRNVPLEKKIGEGQVQVSGERIMRGRPRTERQRRTVDVKIEVREHEV